MKKKLLAAMLLLGAVCAQARDGYRISLSMPDVRDSVVYLVHYYGQSRPHIYISDSARFDRKGNAVFDSRDKDFVGGIYIVLVKDSAQTNFELLINKGDDLRVTAYRSKLPDGIVVKGSVENERFLKYLDYMKTFGEGQKALEDELKVASSAADTAAVRKRAVAASKERVRYMHNYAEQYKGTLLAKVFDAMEVPEVPEGPHMLEDGKTKDSTFAYRYYKGHYWDKFDFKDDRLVYTPVYDGKIEEYISKLTVQCTDSMEKECDMLLGKAKGTKDMFHYTLFWLTRYVETSKIMGMDEVFVYLVENYYMKGDAFWLTDEQLAKYIKRGQDIAPNVIGNVAPFVKTTDIYTGKAVTMQDTKAKYTMLVFYSPTCGHCDHEIPLLDSVYEATLKMKGVRVYTVATEGTEQQVKDFLKKKKLETKWTNTWDPDYKSDARQRYDVYSTPTIYLMDEKKIIKGKRLDHNNVAGLIDMLEKQAVAKK